jgi:hypothetical protein
MRTRKIRKTLLKPDPGLLAAVALYRAGESGRTTLGTAFRHQP